jgi:curli biogenesis system outer membrane secretion channel CsgG
MKNRYFLACAICFLLLSGESSYCQFLSGNDFYANTVEAPELTLESAKKIAILNFTDENNPSYNYWNDTRNMGGKVADAIVANLLNDSYGLEKSRPLYFTGFRTNIFTVVERSQLDNVLKEQKLGVSGAIGDSEASQAGKLLGLDVIISGAVSYSHRDAKDQSSTKDDKGNVTYTYTVSRIVNASARVKFIKVETGQVLAVKEFTTETRESKSDHKIYPYSQLASADVIAERAFNTLSHSVTKYFMPSYSYTGLDIMKIKKEYKDQYKEAVDYMKDKRIDKALIVFNDIYSKDSYNQECANNLAVLYEGTANYEKALEFYKVSAELNPEKKSFKEAITRTENLIKLKKMLETNYDVKIVSYEFAEAGSGSSKLADKVTTRGKTKDRYDVRETPNETGAVVAKVPGDTEFEVIEKSGNWVKIKLLGGKSGYIVNSDVRE